MNEFEFTREEAAALWRLTPDPDSPGRYKYTQQPPFLVAALAAQVRLEGLMADPAGFFTMEFADPAGFFTMEFADPADFNFVGGNLATLGGRTPDDDVRPDFTVGEP